MIKSCLLLRLALLVVVCADPVSPLYTAASPTVPNLKEPDLTVPQNQSSCVKRPRVAAWTSEAGSNESLFLAGTDLPPDASLVVQPIVGGPPLQVRSRWSDSSHLLVMLPMQTSPDPLLASVGGGECWSEPLTINVPQAWWTYPANPTLGGRLRVFGRSLQKGSALRLYLESSGGVGRWLAISARSDYWLETALPADLQPGAYRIWLHAGGGRFGWSEPLSIQVIAPTRPSDQSVAVNNSEELRQALLSLTKSGGAIHLAEGHYALTEPLTVPAGVQLVGAGAQRTVLQFGPVLKATPGLVKARASYEQSLRLLEPVPGQKGEAAKAAVLLFGSNSGLAALGIDGGGVAEQGVAIIGAKAVPVEHIVLRDVRVESLAMFTPQQLHGRNVAVLARHVRGLEIRDSVLIGRGPALYLEDVTSSAFIGNSLGGDGEGVITGREGGVRRSLIENNHLLSKENGAPQAVRAIWLSTLFGSTYENYIAHNHGADFHPPSGTNQNRGEAILLETALSHPYFGHLVAAGEDWIALPHEGVDWFLLEPDLPTRATRLDDYFVVVLDGPGQGQARRIVARDGDRLRLERPWRILPDQRSLLVLTELFYRNLIVGNRIQNAMTGVQLWIGGVENVIADNQLSNLSREGILLFSAASGGPQNQPPFWPIPGRNLAGFNRGIGPSYFNTITGNIVSDAQVGISVSTSDFRVLNGPIDWPLSMGNVVRENQVDHTRSFGVWSGRRGPWNSSVTKVSGFSLIGNLVEKNEVQEAPTLYGSDERSSAIVFRHNQGRLSRNVQDAKQLLVRPEQVTGWLIEGNSLEVGKLSTDSPDGVPSTRPHE